jgi:hypothetical protein
MARKDPEHVPEIIDSKFNRRPADTATYRENCQSGYVFTTAVETAAGQSHFHHILPIQTLGSAYLSPQDKKDFFHQCMAMTEWNINDGHNLIGLPTKAVYRSHEGSRKKPEILQLSGLAASEDLSAERNEAARQAIFGAIPDLPCHQNQHDVYNIKVINHLKRQVWQPLVKEQKNCKLSPVALRERLRNSSDHWRKFLVRRGAEHQGASHCWVHRNDRGYRSFWYVPFSMHPGTPPKVPPPPDLSGVAKSKRKAWLSSLFSR